MKRLILAAGVAAMAITAPALSQPSDRGGGKERAQVQKSDRGGGARAERGGQRAQAQAPQRAQQARGQRADRVRGNERRAQAQQARGQQAERRGNERRAQAQQQRSQRAERAQNQRVREQRAQSERRQNQQARAQQAQRNERAQNQRVREQRAERAQTPRMREQRRVQAQREAAIDRRFSELERHERRQLDRTAQRRVAQIDRIPDWQNRRLARLAETRVVPLSQWDQLARNGVWLNGCPPGLAKKRVPCVPPGQVRNVVGQPVTVLRDRVQLSELPTRLRYVYADTDRYYYRYGNGYVYRVDRTGDIVRALLPLFGLGLTVGQQFPATYTNYYMPTRLQPFYVDDPYTSYRYANGYVYQVDPRTGLIAGVDPLLGYGHGHGQMMPATYSAYNVPYQYRPVFYDTSDYYYRYAPGAIYQVDAQTSLVTGIAALLGNGLTVGQPLPAGYGVYNVPYDYRTTYYDTPNAMYRYANGNIFRVDPTTRLVTAIVASILT